MYLITLLHCLVILFLRYTEPTAKHLCVCWHPSIVKNPGSISFYTPSIHLTIRIVLFHTITMVLRRYDSDLLGHRETPCSPSTLNNDTRFLFVCGDLLFFFVLFCSWCEDLFFVTSLLTIAKYTTDGWKLLRFIIILKTRSHTLFTGGLRVIMLYSF